MKEIISDLKKIKDKVITNDTKGAIDGINDLVKYCEKAEAIQEAKEAAIPTPEACFEALPCGTILNITASECNIFVEKKLEDE